MGGFCCFVRTLGGGDLGEQPIYLGLTHWSTKVREVQTVLGHSSAVITLQTNSHLWTGDGDRTRDVMDAALGPLADSLRTAAASDG